MEALLCRQLVLLQREFPPSVGALKPGVREVFRPGLEAFEAPEPSSSPRGAGSEPARADTGLTGHGWVAAEASNPPSLHIFGISSREIRSGIGQG